MHLVRLIYVSEVVGNVSNDDIEQILTSARKNNDRFQVTGLLCFNRKYFLQCLEGSREMVNKTYHLICNDKRHDNIVLLDYREIDHRAFHNWSMGYMPESSLTSELNLKYSYNNEFTPYEMNGEGCHKFMMELSNTVPVL